MQLDRDQQQAVEIIDGPVLVDAGPGSGKTRVLVERVVRLVESGIPAENILALTFTNKATGEMRKRLEGRVSGNITISTFHALSYDILQEHGGRVGVEDIRSEFDEATLSFDDLLPLLHQLFLKHEDILHIYQDRFRYILVDEYQDTNEIQGKVLTLLGSQHGNVFVIGDPNQAIYGFRGATLRNFHSFSKYFPNPTHISLFTNYRSCPSISSASSLVLGKQGLDVGPEVTIFSCASDRQEVSHILRAIKELVGGSDMQETDRGMEGSYSFGDIAVLYRLKSIGREFEKAFSSSGIPYQIVGEGSFFDRPEIQEALTLLQTYDFSKDVYAGLQKKYDDDTDVGRRKYENILQLKTMILSYDSPEELLRDALLSREEDEPLRENVVTLMTAHASKGLEFPVVFIPGVEEDLFPYARAADIDEEKRLLYVAMTRAKERLYITYAGRRMVYGKTLDRTPSRFLDALPENVIPHVVLKTKKNRKPQQHLL